MTRVRAFLGAVALMLLPSGVVAQCAIDLIESGVEAYRDLELERSQDLLRSAIDLNGWASARCSTQNARALTYLGASHWLRQRPDSARLSFERAVLEAPRFRPDQMEFPPDITSLFDGVRRSTPAVAVTLPDEVELGPRGDQTLFVRLTASTAHWITVSVLGADGDAVRSLYRGPIVEGSQGTAVEWDGRDFTGELVQPGSYDFEVVSADGASQPIRKVVVELTIDSDMPVEPRIVRSVETVEPVQVRMPVSGGGVWSGVAAASAGLLGGAVVIGLPLIVDGFPARWERYPVAASLGVAGVIGLFQRLRRAEPEPVGITPPAPNSAVPEAPPPTPTLRIRSGPERRIELGNVGTGFGALGGDASRGAR